MSTNSKCEYTRCTEALCSGAYLLSVYPWGLAVSIAGELQAAGGARFEVVYCDAP